MAEVKNTYCSAKKIYWQDIRKCVAKVEPIFARLVDELNTDKNFPLFLAHYPYGDYIADTKTAYLSKENGEGYYSLDDPNLPTDLKKHLGYAAKSSPLALLLDKQMELFVDLPELNTTSPYSIYKPGDIFPFVSILNPPGDTSRAPNGVLSLTSGMRSAFLLAPAGRSGNHFNLQRNFKVNIPPPKKLYEHWEVFKEISQSKEVTDKWSTSILFFSANWIHHLWNDPAWARLKVYLHQLAAKRLEFSRSELQYEVAYSLIQKNRNLKPNPYLSDTAKHLLAIAVGAVPSFIPATSDEGLPLALLQQAFLEFYDLKQLPTIMQPGMHDLENGLPSYYSLQYPSTFSPPSRKASNTLLELRELAHILMVFQQELRKESSICHRTALQNAVQKMRINYYHNELDSQGLIIPSNEIVNNDSRFNFLSPTIKKGMALPVAFDSPFLRGCISLQKI